MGRKKADIDWNRVGEMFEADCTIVGVAATLGVHIDTLAKRCRTDLKTDLSDFKQQKKAKGDELLRELQLKSAKAGNIVMQIWLGKQRLGQADKSEQTQTIKQVQVQWVDSAEHDSHEITDSVH